jgi:hypothetical protein
MDTHAIPGIIEVFAVMGGAILALSAIAAAYKRQQLRANAMHPDARRFRHRVFVSSHQKFNEAHWRSLEQPENREATNL